MDRTQFDHIMAMPLPQVGDRYRLTDDIDRYPNFVAPKGAIGTVTHTGDCLHLTMDDYLPGCEEWANAIYFVVEDFDAVEFPDEQAHRQVIAECQTEHSYGLPARAFLFQRVERAEPDPVRALAAVFCDCLHDAANEREWDKMRETNRTAPPGVCASHDFCDANMVMAEAFEIVTGHALADDTGETHDADVALWNAAWAIARATYFTLTDGEVEDSERAAAWDAAKAADDQESLRAVMESPPRFLPLDRPKVTLTLAAMAPALMTALDNLVGPGAQHEHTCDEATEHDENSACIYCEARAVLAQAEALK